MFSIGEGEDVCSGRCVGDPKHKYRFLSIHLKKFLKSLAIFCEWTMVAFISETVMF